MAVTRADTTDAAFHAFVEHVITQFAPRRVIWFGSRAEGAPLDQDSDYDLLFEFDAIDDWAGLTRAIRDSHPHPFPLDVLVHTSDEIEGATAGDFLHGVVANARVLYEQ